MSTDDAQKRCQFGGTQSIPNVIAADASEFASNGCCVKHFASGCRMKGCSPTSGNNASVPLGEIKFHRRWRSFQTGDDIPGRGMRMHAPSAKSPRHLPVTVTVPLESENWSPSLRAWREINASAHHADLPSTALRRSRAAAQPYADSVVLRCNHRQTR